MKKNIVLLGCTNSEAPLGLQKSLRDTISAIGGGDS